MIMEAYGDNPSFSCLSQVMCAKWGPGSMEVRRMEVVWIVITVSTILV